ncbi:MAG: hypothetical protein WD648_09540 [Planctomycetaceae bacterium]
MSDYPRPEEIDVIYNTTPQQYDPDGVYAGKLRYFRLTPDIPDISADERFEFHELVPEVIRDYLDEIDYPKMTELHQDSFSEHAVAPRYGSRELGIFVSADPGIVQLELLERLQDEVLRQFPYWRIRFHMECPGDCFEDDVLVYPDEIFMGQFTDKFDVKAAVAHWRRKMIAKQRDLDAVERRRLKWLERKVPQKLAQLKGIPFVVVAVFASTDDDPQHEICLLVRGGSIDFVIENTAPGDEHYVFESTRYPVSAEREIRIRSDEWEGKRGRESFSDVGRRFG